MKVNVGIRREYYVKETLFLTSSSIAKGNYVYRFETNDALFSVKYIVINYRILPFHFSNHKFWKLAVVLLAKGRDQDQCRRRRMVCKAFKVEFL